MTLRAVTLDDTDAIAVLDTDPRTNEHNPNGTPSRAESATALAQYVRCWEEHGLGYWVAEIDRAVVGITGLRPMRWWGRDCLNLYYRFSPDVWGRGLAVEAARAALAVAQEARPGTPVAARTRPTNARAIRVAEAAGLRRRPDLDRDAMISFVHGW
jgi:RimJ/RimL family protein N-acetyltransferase